MFSAPIKQLNAELDAVLNLLPIDCPTSLCNTLPYSLRKKGMTKVALVCAKVEFKSEFQRLSISEIQVHQTNRINKFLAIRLLLIDANAVESTILDFLKTQN